MTKIKEILLNLILVFAAVVIGIALSEFFCRRSFSDVSYKIEYALFKPNMRVVFKPRADLLPALSEKSNFFTNSFGIRGDEISDRQNFRILAIGGSTTESLYVDQERSWPYLLQKELNIESRLKNVWVGNAGKSGLNSRDHIVAEKILLEELPKIDLIIVFSGINDMTVRLSQDKDYKAMRIDENNLSNDQIKRVFAVNPFGNKNTNEGFIPKNGVESCLKCLFKLKYLYSLSKQKDVQDEAGLVYKTWRENRRKASKIINEFPDIKASLNEYSSNLNKIIYIAQKKSLKVVFMTQTSLWKDQMSEEENNLLWMGGVGDFKNIQGQPYYSSRVLNNTLGEYNKTTLEVCRQRNINCFDLAAQLPKDISYYYDDAHYNNKGSAKVAGLVKNFLIKEHFLEK